MVSDSSHVDIFISYAREDEQRVQRLCQALEAQGWSVFWDRRIPAGSTWDNYIGRALAESRCVIVAWSRVSVASEFVREEAEHAKNRGVLVPVLLDPVSPPFGFSRIQAADLSDWAHGDGHAALEQLVADIRRMLSQARCETDAGTEQHAEAQTQREAEARARAASEPPVESALAQPAMAPASPQRVPMPPAPQPVTALEVTAGGAPRPPSPRLRYVMLGTMALLVACIVTLSLLLLGSGHGSDHATPSAGVGTGEAAIKTPSSATQDGTAPAGVAGIDAAVQPPGSAANAGGPEATVQPPGGTASAHGPAAAAPAGSDAAATVQQPTAKPDDRRAQETRAQEQKQIATCFQAAEHNDWQELEDCSRALRALGATREAGAFHDQAMRETRNAAADADARAALRAGKLKEAQALLPKIGGSSVYFKSLVDLVQRAENAQIEDVRRRAQALVNVHGCAALENFVRSLAASDNGTERVVAAATAIKCLDKRPAAPAQPGSTRPGTGSGGDGAAGGSGAWARSGLCDMIDIDQLMAQATAQYTAGFPRAALELVTRALDCKQDPRILRVAVLYACVAHNAAAAKRYFSKLPPQFQSQMVDRCAQENIVLQ